MACSASSVGRPVAPCLQQIVQLRCFVLAGACGRHAGATPAHCDRERYHINAPLRLAFSPPVRSSNAARSWVLGARAWWTRTAPAMACSSSVFIVGRCWAGIVVPRSSCGARVQLLLWPPRVLLGSHAAQPLGWPALPPRLVVGCVAQLEPSNSQHGWLWVAQPEGPPFAHAAPPPCFRRHHDPIISAIEERVAVWTKYNVSHQEDIQARSAV